ncbi:MAG TPA: hypothetical protein VFX17_01345 [Patescibacteria group bacterium]|nr:hypothetical protein [Patescibacteria group bacterium]
MPKLIQKINRIIYRIIEPIFPYVRDALLACGIIHHHGRQRYPVGFLEKNKNAQEFENYLGRLGFRKNKIAWKDEGEILGMRKLDGFDFCYHIRIFSDGEVRGHYERTVESNAWNHFFEIGMEPRTQDFRKFTQPFLQAVPEFEISTATVTS